MLCYLLLKLVVHLLVRYHLGELLLIDHGCSFCDILLILTCIEFVILPRRSVGRVVLRGGVRRIESFSYQTFQIWGKIGARIEIKLPCQLIILLVQIVANKLFKPIYVRLWSDQILRHAGSCWRSTQAHSCLVPVRVWRRSSRSMTTHYMLYIWRSINSLRLSFPWLSSLNALHRSSSFRSLFKFAFRAPTPLCSYI